MKKKVAVFANGWNSENLYRCIQGIYAGAPEGVVDYYVFLCYTAYNMSDVLQKSLSSIYELPDLSLFDAVIIFYPGLNFRESIDLIVKKARESGLPVVCIGAKYDGFYFVGVDNYMGMKELCSHIMEVHGVKNACYIAGSKDNDDSNERLKAVRDSFTEHGLSFRDEDVFYSDWESKHVIKYVEGLCGSKGELPDAFICANDILAEAVSYVLEKYGIKTPEDVILTGFDHSEEGKLFYPSIASVNQNYEEVGKRSAEILYNALQGKEIPGDNRLMCRFFPGESCGCKNCNYEDESRKMYVRDIPRKNINADNMEGRRNRLSTTIVEAVSYDDLKSSLRKEFSEQSGCEGDTFFCMLDARLSQIAEKDIRDIPHYTYAEEMDVVVSKMNRIPGTYGRIKTRDLLPALGDDYKNHLYTFLPIYFDSFVCGYMVFADRLSWFLSTAFYQFEQSFASSIVLYKRNVQVTELNKLQSRQMEQDSLTKVKNRTAYEHYMKEFQNKFNNKEISEFAVVYFDINNLKLINDSLGHEMGDRYIQNCCKYICDYFKSSPVFRIGGDEFVVILTGLDYQCRNDIMDRICEDMKNASDVQELSSEHISVAYGIADYNPETDIGCKPVFRRADERMYRTKRSMKNGKIR